jgi:hypothetical protein
VHVHVHVCVCVYVCLFVCVSLARPLPCLADPQATEYRIAFLQPAPKDWQQDSAECALGLILCLLRSMFLELHCPCFGGCAPSSVHACMNAHTHTFDHEDVTLPGPCAHMHGSFLREKILNRTVRVNVEYREGGAEFVTVFGEDKVRARCHAHARPWLSHRHICLVSNASCCHHLTLCQEDTGLSLVSSGLSTFKGRSAPHLQELLSSYSAAQSAAKSSRKAMWRYGDITEDETPVCVCVCV